MATSDEFKNELESAMKLIAEAKELLGPIQSVMESLNTEQTILSNAKNDKMKQLNELFAVKNDIILAKKAELKPKMQSLQEQLGKAVIKTEELKYQIEKVAKEEEAAVIKANYEAELAEKNLALTKRWEFLAMGLPWREFAKDHQIKGAHQILENRYVIEADPMGLGKTLTSIITCDIAERATKDASPEFPFMGIEKEVFVNAHFTVNETGEKVTGYIPYDTKMKMKNDPNIWTFHDSKYETQIVNSITRPVGRRILYLCPASLIGNVVEEWRMWSPNRNIVFIGGMTREERHYATSHMLPPVENFVVVCNYEAWRRDTKLLEYLNDLKFDTIIIDEAHNAKDPKTNINKGVTNLIEGDHKPEYVIPMTGTPILNRPEELYTLLHMVNSDEFYNVNDFLRNYCWQDIDNRWHFLDGGLDMLTKKIRKNFMRRTKDQAGIILPPKTVIHHDLTVDKEAYPNQARVREQMRKYATIVINEQKGQALSAGAAIAVFTRLRQIETWPAGIKILDKFTKNVILELDVHESQKIDYVIRKSDDGQWDGIIPDAIEDERMVLFSQFKAPLAEIANRVIASGKRAVVLDGSTPDELRQEIRKDFDARHTPNRADSKWDIVLCNYKVGGVGFNFTCASQLIALDEEWNPGKREQAYDRIDRIGQIRPTTIHVVRNKNTIDDWLSGIMEAKEGLVEGFNTASSSMGKQDVLDALDSGLI